MSNVRIGIGKGRGTQQVFEMLEQAGVDVPEVLRTGRGLVVENARRGTTLVLARHRDLPRLLHEGHIDVAIGADVWFFDADDSTLSCVRTLDYGHCRLSLLTSRALTHEQPRRICTRFVNLTRRLLPGTEILELHGCNEITLALGTADGVVDVVETGRTVKEMELHEMRVLARLQHAMWTRANDTVASDLAATLHMTVRGVDVAPAIARTPTGT